MPWSTHDWCVWSRRICSIGRRRGADHGVHAPQALGAGAAGEAQQHGLGLVVEGVAEQDRCSARLFANRHERGIARLARGSLRAALLADVDATHDDRVEAEPGRLLCRPLGHLVAALLQTMVDDHGAGAEAGTRSLEGGGSSECQRVGASGERDEHQLAL